MRTISINTPGPQGATGPQGVAGPSGSTQPFNNVSGSIWATTSSLQVSGSFLVSGSSTFTNIGPAIFSGSATITGPTTMSSAVVSGDVTVLGTASINVLQINTTINSTGSNTLGDTANDTQTLYGSVIIPTGSLTVSGSVITSGSDATINGVRVGRGGGNVADNTALGESALNLNTNGSGNLAISYFALAANVIGSNNTAVGSYALRNSTQSNNTAMGYASFLNLSSGNHNTALGRNSARYIADGSTSLTIANQSVFIGTDTKALADSQTNQIVIGYNAIGLGSNSVVLGNSSITLTALRGNVLINTTTNAGFGLDVSGSGRFTNNLTVTGSTTITGEANVSFLSLSGNTAVNNSGTTMILGTSGAWTGVRIPKNLEVTGSAIISSSASTQLQVGSNFLFVSSSGNVGIGTTTPTASLHISASNTSSAYSFLVQNSSGQTLFSAQNNRTVNINSANAVDGDTTIGTTSGTITFNRGYNNTLLKNALTFYGGGDISTIQGWSSPTSGIAVGYAQTNINPVTGSVFTVKGTATTSGSSVLFVTGSSATRLLKVSSETNADILVVSGSGNVGIGTTSPSQRLTVGTSDSDAILIGVGGRLYLRDTTTYITEGSGLNLVSGATRNIRLNAGGTDRLFVSASGNVGIGTSTPTALLHISGSSSAALLRVDSPTVSGSLFVSGSGNVGIGTITPTNTLDVDGTARVSGALTANTLTLLGNTLFIAGATVGGLFATRYTNSVSYSGGHVFTNSTTNISATSGDNFTLQSIQGFAPTSGTATYGALAIAPTINQTGGANGITRGLYINPTLTSAADYRAIETTSGSISFNHGSIPLLFASSSGKVGIGTLTPASTLSVSGRVGISARLRVGTTGDPNSTMEVWGDQIFATGAGGIWSTFVQSTERLGVGTSSPSSKVHIKGAGATSATTALLVENANASASLVVLDNGYVGINTGSAQYNLDVNGTARVLGASGATATLKINTVNRANGMSLRYSDASDVGSIVYNNIFYLTKNDGTFPFYITSTSNVLINTITDVASSQLTVESTTKGFLPPRMTNAQRTSITSPAVGLMVYCTDATEGLYIYKSTGWTFIV